MNQHLNFVSLIVLLITLCLPLISFAQNVNDKALYKNNDYPIDKRVEDVVSRMTLGEKIDQLINDAPANKRLDIPKMKHGELLHGVVLKKGARKEWGLESDEGPVIFPQAIAMGSTWDPNLVERIANDVAREARSVGITHAYSPVLGVARDPRFGRVEETYGEDPYLVSKMGVSYINGLQGMGDDRFDYQHVLATGKHFAGYQHVKAGLNGAYTDISKRTLWEIDFPPFEAAVKKAHLACIMPSYSSLNGIPAHMNHWLLHDILRKKWGFSGFVVSDNIDIYRLYSMHHIAVSDTAAVILGLKAGVDLELVLSGAQYATYQNTLAHSIKTNKINKKYLDQPIKRIREAKFKIGLFDDYRKENPKKVLGTPEHQKLALKAAEKSIILLKNDGILPLNKHKYHNIAIIGPHGNDVPYGDYTGGAHIQGISLLQALPGMFPENTEIRYAKGASITDKSKKGFDKAIKLAKKSDLLILCIGGSGKTGGEGNDRDELGLPGGQQELFDTIQKTGKPIVTILNNGRPLAISTVAKKSKVLIEDWYLGSKSGKALSNILVGDYNPGGKLTMSFPRKIGQLPSYYEKHYSFPGAGKGEYYKSDKSPLFPFGFGLSYTTIDTDGHTTVSVDITNTGKRAGDEVVQFYVTDEYASISPFKKLLKGFRRVTLKPEETKTVTFNVGFNELSMVDKNLTKIVEPGKFYLRVGDSSANTQSVELKVKAQNSSI